MSSPVTYRASTRTASTRVSTGRHPATTIPGLNSAPEPLVPSAPAGSAAIVGRDRLAAPQILVTRARRMLWTRVQPALSAAGIAASREPSRPAEDAPPSPGEPIEAAPPASPPKPQPSAISRVELSIDSLRNYDLIRPIPVVIESLGERNYVAEMPDLNISTSASNPSDILITLKDRIAQVYDGLRILKYLDGEQARQLKILEGYIAKPRRGWLDRR